MLNYLASNKKFKCYLLFKFEIAKIKKTNISQVFDPEIYLKNSNVKEEENINFIKDY